MDITTQTPVQACLLFGEQVKMVRKPDGNDIKLPAKNLTIQYCISSEALNAKNHVKSELALKEKQEQRLERKVG